MIEVKNVRKWYGPKLAVNDVSFSVADGEILGFLGPNGAGKSTTMKMITGYLPPTEGTVTIDGYDVANDSLNARRVTGYLPETTPLYLEMTVHGYLDFMARARGVPGRHRKEAIDRTIEQTQLTNVRKTIVGKLSKGYRQRVGIAQAIIHDPKVLVLDEPTIGLDPRQIIETRNLIRGMSGERSVILSSHILPEVSMTCSRVVIINDGTVVAEDTPENLTKRMSGVERLQLEIRGAPADVESTLKAVPDVASVSLIRTAETATFVVDATPNADVREAIAAAVVNGGFGLLGLSTVGMSLEDVFIRLVTKEDISA